MNEINCLLIGAIGGFISALGALSLTQWYWKRAIRRMAEDKHYALASITVQRMTDDIATLRMQVVTLQTIVGDGE